MSLQISLEDLESLIRDRLKAFYDRRIAILRNLKLEDLTSKNPYLFRAVGITEASQLVEALMRSRLIKSDETIFGKEFFEEIAKSVGNAEKASQLGMDLVIQTNENYIVMEMKSADNWKNARMGRGILKDFGSAYQDFLSSGAQKEFISILGQATGQQNWDGETEDGHVYLIRSGQRLWETITGDSDFYLKLMRLMKDYPLRFRPDYVDAWSAASNRLNREFAIKFVEPNGSIDWEELTRANSGYVGIRKTRNRSPES
jgi:hypothetical protein